MNEYALPAIAILVGVGALCQWVAWRVRLPAIIFLLLVGILVGPVLNLFDPQQLFGELFFPFISLSVAIILFEGSLTLKFKEIFGLQRVVRNMVSIGMLVTWMITALATHFALDISWQISFLFGAITVVTGPTVIIPMLRTVRPKASVANILRWEGIVIDPIGASLAVLVYEFIISGGGHVAFGHALMVLSQIVIVGMLMGAGCGYMFGLALRRHWLPEYLHSIVTLGLVLLSFVASNMLHEESGLVTVTVMGIWLANMKDVDTDEILNFKESLSILLISMLFIMLAARLEVASFKALGWSALWVFLAIQFLARPLSIVVSTIGSTLTWPERHLLAWIAPRGIVAAAISALFALRLVDVGFAGAEMLVPLTFLVIIGTVLLQSTTARIIALWLGVAEPEPKGFLIVGASIVGRDIGKALMNSGFRVQLAATSWDDATTAKLEGLPTYHGNLMSEHAERHLDFVGIGRLLALSSYDSVNMAAVLHYRMELGKDNVYMLQSKSGDVEKVKQIPAYRRGKLLFSEGVTYSTLAAKLKSGGVIKVTKLTESFSFDNLHDVHGEDLIPLFAIDPRENIQMFTQEKSIDPGAGWSVISLVPNPSPS
ncbi:sodium/proton antiporter, CPA1 family [Desulfuromusa kysingii]|uniref:Sodium/proton antiporter, CPA1 family n=1 Tax=Desulfuromusa kysingii TaxID=37625 RepID=A0A1H3W1P8_9BACT|nr:sodium:proton antiporter [Desulfuromusa kysingii]SDZ80248.1 sodium/proton antiporter, CPA1 family [Desulfuromusa kysingii]